LASILCAATIIFLTGIPIARACAKYGLALSDQLGGSVTLIDHNRTRFLVAADHQDRSVVVEVVGDVGRQVGPEAADQLARGYGREGLDAFGRAVWAYRTISGPWPRRPDARTLQEELARADCGPVEQIFRSS
ncbi:hypothetical protein ACWCRC_40235, partial [Streptomyces sp. NPDC001940]